MPRAVDPDEARVEFERKACGLVGLEVLALTHWDIHNFSDADRVWDYGDWHHAVMGVELATDADPRTLVWTDTFFPYGAEVFNDPIDQHLTLGPEGPEGWDVGAHPEWQARLGQPVVAELTLVPTDDGGRKTPLLGGSGPGFEFKYRPNWGLPGMTPPEQSGAMVFGFDREHIEPGTGRVAAGPARARAALLRREPCSRARVRAVA